MARSNQLTVVPEQTLESKPKSILARRPKNEISIQAEIPQAQALLIQELEISFDPDLCAAMIGRLVQAQQEINALTSNEEKLTKTVELGRLAAIEKARASGIQQARAEFAEKMKKLKREQQQKFIDIELPKLIGACELLSEEQMKETVEAFASRLKVEISWEETDAGLQCTAKPIA
jgi:hypothetical protein